MDPALIAELAPLAGGRVQRADLVADRELVLEIRLPGRTVRLLLCWRPGSGRIHVIGARPPRLTEGGDLQRTIRKRIEGRPLVAFRARAHTIEVEVEGTCMEARTKQGLLAFLPPSGQAAPPMPEPEAVPERFPLSEALAEKHGIETEDAAAKMLRAALVRQLGDKRKKLSRLLQNLARDEEKLEAMAKSRHQGELLKTVLAKLARGQREVKVFDWETNAEVTLELDPSVGPKQNMERLFVRAKKAERGRPIVEARRKKTEAELAALDARKEEIEKADLEALIALGAASGYATGGLAGGAAEKEEREKKKPIDRVARKFLAADGTEIRVGKGASENDRLTFSFARGDDVWMHASGTAGAHVLVRVQKGKAASAAAMEDAALLAAHYSGAKAHAEVEVVWTEARWVKKSKGDPPGRVSVAKPRVLRVIVDKARLDALFGRG